MRAQRRSARTDEDDIALFLLPSSAPGLRVGLHKHLDLTHRVCAVELAGVSVDSEAMLAGGADLYRRLLGIGAVAIAADSLGGMERALEMAVEYSKVREQFGKPIGAYQRRGSERQAKACPTVSADNRGLVPLARCSGSVLGSAMK